MTRRILDLVPWCDFSLPADPILATFLVATSVFIVAGMAVISMVVVVPLVWPLPEKK